jgi:hypothetical protein
MTRHRIIGYNMQRKHDGLQPKVYAMAAAPATFVHKNTGTHAHVEDNIPDEYGFDFSDDRVFWLFR